MTETNSLINNRGLSYGDGFFSTMGVYAGQILWLDYHHKRFQTHAMALQLSLNINQLMVSLQQQAKLMVEGILKVVITRQAQAISGYGFTNGLVEIQIKAMPMIIYSTVGNAKVNMVKLGGNSIIAIQSPITAICLTSQIACLPRPLAGLKTINRLDNVLAAGELEGRKLTSKNSEYAHLNYPLKEGLVSDVSGNWIEGVMSNVFYQLYGSQKWHTPPVDKSGVAGVMRQVLLDDLVIDKLGGTTVIERILQDDDLDNIRALFFTNAVRGIIPVDKLILPIGAVKAMEVYF